MVNGTSSPSATSTDAEVLRSHVQRFLRSFGALANEITPCGQSIPVSYAHALMILRETSGGDDAPAMGDLAAELGIDKSNVTRLCRRMEDAGHLKLKRCDSDGRARRLLLTTKGRQVELSSRQRFEGILSHVPEGLRHETLLALETLCVAIGQSLVEEDKS